jgi:hypothetical protein
MVVAHVNYEITYKQSSYLNNLYFDEKKLKLTNVIDNAFIFVERN